LFSPLSWRRYLFLSSRSRCRDITLYARATCCAAAISGRPSLRHANMRERNFRWKQGTLLPGLLLCGGCVLQGRSGCQVRGDENHTSITSETSVLNVYRHPNDHVGRLCASGLVKREAIIAANGVKPDPPPTCHLPRFAQSSTNHLEYGFNLLQVL
jgi:hypothetical protein